MRRALLPTVLLCVASIVPWPAGAQGIAESLDAGGPLTPAPGLRAPSVVQHLDAKLPLQAAFTDGEGRSILLADMFHPIGRTAAPVILVPGYYRCAQLCGLVVQGLLEAALATGLPAASYRIVFVSIDPADTPADATTRRRTALAYAHFLDAAATPPAVEALVGSPSSIAALTHSVGFDYRAGTPPRESPPSAQAASRFEHPATAIVCTPDGRVSRYLMGVRFDARELRAALVDAGGGGIGTLTDRIALLCAHLDPRVGRSSAGVLAGVRVLGLATILGIGLLLWRARARARTA